MKGSDSILEGQGTDDQPAIARTPTYGKLRPTQQAVVEGRSTERERRSRAGVQTPRPRPRRTDSRRSSDAIETALREARSARRRPDHASTSAAWWSAWSRGTWSSRPTSPSCSPRGQQVVDTLAPVLRGAARTPLRSTATPTRCRCSRATTPTDWDLSAARAVTVLRRLNEAGGMPEGRLSLSAFGHEKPLVDPERPGLAAGQQAGRHRRPPRARRRARPAQLLADASAPTDRAATTRRTTDRRDHQRRRPRRRPGRRTERGAGRRPRRRRLR